MRDFTMTLFTKEVIDIIQRIPKGRVMTYGQIAGCVANPRAARQVVRILHSMSGKYNLPWHRVINSKGFVALRDDKSYYEQITSLKIEGVEVGLDGSVDLLKYQWDPV
jgi:methylated-DNA-protein-cysteine methyltransferase-like protein